MRNVHLFLSLQLALFGFACSDASEEPVEAGPTNNDSLEPDGAVNNDNNTLNNENNGGASCGDGVCSDDESPQVCPADCASVPDVVCGDGRCDEGEEGCPEDCAPESVCGDGQCDGEESQQSCPEDCGAPPECEDGQTECRNGAAFVCEGGAWAEGECPEDHICVGSGCVEVVCAPNEARCVDELTVGVCNFNGTEEESFLCPEGSQCADAVCSSPCEPGARRCSGAQVLECQEGTLTEEVVEECDGVAGLTCLEGECVSSCDAFDDKGGYIGCDYWGVDTPNRPGIGNRFAYVVSNVNAVVPADVVVATREGEVIVEQQIQPLEVATLLMPLPRAMNVSDTGNPNASTLTDFGFRITTTVPINAYQFNPLQRFDEGNRSVASNDASLMLPDSVLGTEYIGVSFRHWGSGQFVNYPSFLSIVSTADNNDITVTPSSAIVGGEGIPALAAGQSHVFTLMGGQVLTLKSGSANGDLTGTIISADENVGVFGGVDCAQVPLGSRYCDHIEEQIFPVQAWDTEYYATKFSERGAERDVWRIVAAEDETTITTEPAQIDVPVLNRGEVFEFLSSADFKVIADKPVLVAQYMTGSSTTSSTNDGDPSMLLAVPARQYRRGYVFLVPETYERDWVTITFPDGAAILFDGEPLDILGADPIGQTGFNVLRMPVEDGRHEVESDLPVGVSVYGYDFNISYAYPAGLDLSEFGTD